MEVGDVLLDGSMRLKAAGLRFMLGFQGQFMGLGFLGGTSYSRSLVFR